MQFLKVYEDILGWLISTVDYHINNSEGGHSHYRIMNHRHHQSSLSVSHEISGRVEVSQCS